MIKKALLALAICAAAILPQASAQALAPPPVEAFFDNPEFGSAYLSPSGKYIAARVGGKGRRIRLAVYEIATGKANAVAQFDDADINQVQWISDDRLLFNSMEPDVGYGQMRYAPGLYAINRDGTKFKRLAERSNPFIRAAGGEKLLP